MNGRTDHRAEVARLRAEIARRKRRGKGSTTWRFGLRRFWTKFLKFEAA